MDLNHLYSQHQIALMKAGAAANAADRHQHLECATSIARTIGDYQQARGARAGSAWQGDHPFRFLPPMAAANMQETPL